MADPPFLAVERRTDGVAVVRLHRPPANALSAAVLDELASAVADLAAHPPGAVVVTGGERIFAAGADVREFRHPGQGAGAEAAAEVSARFHLTLGALAALPRATIAAVSGYALGGGCELALACDLRVADETARLGQPEILLGIIPGAGGTQRLARLVGPARAKDLVLTGRQVGAEEALRIGLVDRVVPAGQALAAALELASPLARGPLQAHARAKRAVDEGLELRLEDGLRLERALFAEVFATEDAAAGVRSFLERGPGRAEFTGR